jgi:RNA polymerase sigma-70 factor (ECF subfamily)
VNEREVEWADLMRAANSGDNAAYERVLRLLAPALRTFAGRAVARTRTQVDAEDIVQETLIAIHLKRHTWIESEPIGPWIRAIARHKMIDALRRRGHRVHIPIEDLEDVLPAQETVSDYPRRDIERHLPRLPARQRDVIQAIAIQGQSIRQTAELLKMTEGAVRVALHRGVAALAAIVNRGAP